MESKTAMRIFIEWMDSTPNKPLTHEIYRKATELRDTVENEQLAHYESILKEKEEENRKISERSVDIMFENAELKCREKRLVEALDKMCKLWVSTSDVFYPLLNEAAYLEAKQLLTENNHIITLNKKS